MDSTPKLQNADPITGLSGLPPGDYVMEPKMNGFRLSARIHSGGVEFMTRSGKRQDGKLPHLEDELRQMFPPGTVVDGELTWIQPSADGTKYEEDFAHVQSVMNSLPKRAVQVQRDTGKHLQLLVFDCIALGEEDMRQEPMEQRRNVVNSVISVAGAKYVQRVPTFEATQEQHDALLELGFEGSMVKDLGAMYHSGRRGFGWYKWKAQPTVDVVILGEGKPGEGRNAGKVGSILFGQRKEGAPHSVPLQPKLETVWVDGWEYVVRGKAAGIDDDERDWVTANMDKLVGTVMEVAHMGIYPNGITMRHPQFKRFRPDKPAEQVDWHDS